MALETPFPSEGLAHQIVACAAGLVIRTVVCSHDGLDPGVHQSLEGRKICLCKILLRGNGIEFVPEALRSAVDCKMLRAGGCLHHRPLSLKTSDELDTQCCREARILSQSLVTAAPSGISENVDVGRPECQALVDVPVPA